MGTTKLCCIYTRQYNRRDNYTITSGLVFGVEAPRTTNRSPSSDSLRGKHCVWSSGNACWCESSLTPITKSTSGVRTRAPEWCKPWWVMLVTLLIKIISGFGRFSSIFLSVNKKKNKKNGKILLYPSISFYAFTKTSSNENFGKANSISF